MINVQSFSSPKKGGTGSSPQLGTSAQMRKYSKLRVFCPIPPSRICLKKLVLPTSYRGAEGAKGLQIVPAVSGLTITKPFAPWRPRERR